MPKKSLGYCITAAGHIRYTSPASLRGQYAHRVIFEGLLRNTPDSIRRLIPPVYEIHHMDFHKSHNCGSNLLATTIEIHSAMTAAGRIRDPYTGQFLSREGYEKRYGVGKFAGTGLALDDEIPF
jgi:hypothetical protein